MRKRGSEVYFKEKAGKRKAGNQKGKTRKIETWYGGGQILSAPKAQLFASERLRGELDRCEIDRDGFETFGTKQRGQTREKMRKMRPFVFDERGGQER